jgi:tRNA pseudouridine38-40 synthase
MSIADSRQRIAVGIEYDGARYAGWQRQTDADSVQARVEQALGAVADHPVEVTCGGRTDAGVHALGQVAHFDTTARRPMRGWALGANTALPADIAVLWAVQVPAGFHARYAATSRSYRYLILNRAVRPALARQRACWIHQALDVAAMHQAAQCLLGEHDFSAFRSAECQSRSPIRRVDRIAVCRDGDLVTLDVTANAFLHHMVRNIAGTLIAVGRGDRSRQSVAEALASRDRRAAGVTAPPGGLYLLRIDYPRTLGLPDPDPGASAMIHGP